MTKKNEQPSYKVDLVIAGGAYVGLSLAVAIKSAAPQLEVVVIDAVKSSAWKKDPRASAITAAAVRMIGQLGCWQSIFPDAEPICEMIVTDSRITDPVRPVFLTFSGDVKPGEPFAFMVENRYLNASFHQRADSLGIPVIEGVRVEKFMVQGPSVHVYLDNGSVYQGRLLVAADGVRSKMRDMAGIRTFHQSYGQIAIVCTVAHEKPHNGRATEHFLPAGPFAILPLKGNRSSLVWNERDEDARQLLAADDMIFKAKLETRFGHQLGHLRVEGERRAFSFGLTLARDFVRSRFALVGDAAHGIHPISGQGLNLGFRDAAALAEVIVETARLGLDIGSMATLERYQTWRRFETVRVGITTDMLNRMFSNDLMPLRTIRDIGLSLVDHVPILKNYFIRQAAGLLKGSPRLLLGKPI